MSTKCEFILRVLFMGVGATIVMDLWAVFLKLFGIKGLNFSFLGRWIGHLPQGQWFHESIAKSAPVKGELLMGWCAHYSIGISFAALLVTVYSLDWARSPSLMPALFIGIITVVAPLMILQPALGAGYFSSNTPTPIFNSIKSLVTHTVYGGGLYLSAKLFVSIFPNFKGGV